MRRLPRPCLLAYALATVALLLACGGPTYSVKLRNDTAEPLTVQSGNWRDIVSPGRESVSPAFAKDRQLVVFRVEDKTGALIGCLPVPLGGLTNQNVRVDVNLSAMGRCEER